MTTTTNRSPSEVPSEGQPPAKTSAELRGIVARLDAELEKVRAERQRLRTKASEAETATVLGLPGEPSPDLIYSEISTLDQRERALLVSRAGAVTSANDAAARESAEVAARHVAAYKAAQGVTDAALALVYESVRELRRQLAGLKTAHAAEKQRWRTVAELREQGALTWEQVQAAERETWAIPAWTVTHDRITGAELPQWRRTKHQHALAMREMLDEALVNLTTAEFHDQLPTFLSRFEIWEEAVRKAEADPSDEDGEGRSQLSLEENEALAERLVAGLED